MVSSALLTFCAGMACSILESEVDYNIVSASNSVHVLRNELKAARVRLRGFSEWLLSKTDSDTWDMLNGIDQTINPPLQEIRKTVNEGIAQGKDAEHCYTEAHGRAKEEATKHLALIMPCIETFTKTTDATLIDLPNRLSEINKLEEDINKILPDCEQRIDKGICIHKRVRNVTVSILNIESFTRTAVEKGNGDYLAQLATAIRCLTERFENLGKEMSVITSEANICVRKS